MMKKFIKGVLALAVVAGLTACGGGNEANEGNKANEGGAGEEMPSQLIIATGGTSGTYYPLGGGIAQIISDNTEVTATAQVTGGSVENMRLLGSKEVELAFTQNDIADYANTGALMFEEGGAVENLQAVGTLYNETVQIVVPENSDIASVADLAGRKVSVGSPGSGVEANASQILEIYGMTFDDLEPTRLSFGDSVAQIQDGSLDAAFVTAGAPTSAVSELSATKGVKLIALDADKIAALIEKYPYYVEETIPGDTYPGVADTTTVAVKAMLTVSSTLPEQFVYDMTKALFENTGQLVAINQKAASITPENAVQGLNIDLHPGALKYFEEIGVK